MFTRSVVQERREKFLKAQFQIKSWKMSKKIETEFFWFDEISDRFCEPIHLISGMQIKNSKAQNYNILRNQRDFKFLANNVYF